MFGEDNYVVYTVKSGDTLNKISSMYGVSVADIAKANMIDNVNLIEVGQEIMIPEIYTGSKDAPPVFYGPVQPPVVSSAGKIPTGIKGNKVPTSQGLLGAQQKPGLLSGTLFGIPKIYAYGGIAVLTAGLALLIVSSKKSTPALANPKRKRKSTHKPRVVGSSKKRRTFAEKRASRSSESGR